VIRPLRFARSAALGAGLVGVGLASASVLHAQAKPARPAASTERRCQLQIVNVDRQGVRTEPTKGVENLFAGGNVHVVCRGQNIHIYADSVASYGGSVVQFISLGRRVRYRDSTTTLDADFGTYFKDGERFEAQGNVVHKDLKNGSSITGPRVDYYRPIKNVRNDLQVLGYNRPTIVYAVKDSLGKPAEPYTIVGNQVKIVGSDVIFAGGAVTFKRSDLDGKSDSLWLDSGKLERGQMLGHASLGGGKADSFNLTAKDIDIRLRQRELAGLKAKANAKLVSKDVNLDADSIQIEMVDRQAERTRAWGKTVRPEAVSGDYRIRGDSLLIETPGQRLERVQAFGSAWAGLKPDSAAQRRDWISGEKVIALFVDRDSAGVKKTAISELQAENQARSFYQMAPERPNQPGSINYTRASRIVVKMRVTADSNTVESVSAEGAVDGVHLQPALKADSTKVDSTRRANPPRALPARPPGGDR